MGFVIFFAVFFLVYFGANYYVFIRGWQGLQVFPALKMPYLVLFLFLSLAYLVMRFLGKFLPSPVDAVLYWSGSFWFAAILYFFLMVLSLDILRLGNHFFHFFPPSVTGNYLKVKGVVTLSLMALVFLLLLAGYINTLFPATREMTFTLHKPSSSFKTLKIAFASDIHMGTLVGKNRVAGLVRKMNEVHPDVIILGGDLLDEIHEPIFRNDIGAPLRNLKAPLGVYAVTGNHEYIGGIESSVKYIESVGVTLLRDTSILLNGNVYLVGREDRSKGGRFDGSKRKSLEELLQQVNFTNPVVVIDHQPFHLDEVAKTNVDLQISGHTHHGQMWPFSALTKAIYELSWGSLKKGNTYFYVSNGYGTWGPPVRLGNRPEIAVITLKNE